MKSICLGCKTDIEYHPSQQLGKYCSNKCQARHKNRLLVESGKADSRSARTYLRRTRKYQCECGIVNWNGKPLTLQLDHIDGNVKNSLPSNLRWLCPNCHTQTETWGSANIKDCNRKKLVTSKGL